MNWKSIAIDDSLVNEELIVAARYECSKSKDLFFTNNIPMIRKLAR